MPLFSNPVIKTTTTKQAPAQPAEGVVKQSMALANPYTIAISPPPSAGLPRLSKFARKKKLILTKNINMAPIVDADMSDPIRAFDENYWLPSLTQIKINSKYNLEPSSTEQNSQHSQYLIDSVQDDISVMKVINDAVCFFRTPYTPGQTITTDSGEVIVQGEDHSTVYSDSLSAAAAGATGNSKISASNPEEYEGSSSDGQAQAPGEVAPTAPTLTVAATAANLMFQ